MRNTRTGFTLVELLVVMALIAIVATMAVMFFPSAATANREATAAQQLQSWLNIAKQRAVRNQRPSGLRLWVTSAFCSGNPTAFPNVVTECQYIEQPDDFRTGTLSTVPPGTQPMMPSYKTVFDVIQIAGVDLMNGYTPAYVMTKPNAGNPLLPLVPPEVAPKGNLVKNGQQAYDPSQIYWSVQPCPFVLTNPYRPLFPYVPNPLGYGGDSLEVFNNGMVHQIIAVYETNFGGSVPVSTFQIWPPLPNAITNPTSNFRILRGPRVVGTETLTFPDNTFIDLNTNMYTAYNSPLPNWNDPGAVASLDAAETANAGTGYVDILFSPSGQVITPGVATANLNFWVRCPSEDSTKSHAAVPPGPSNGNEFLGAPTIVSVFVRTGFVGAYPPSPNAADPYLLVK